MDELSKQYNPKEAEDKWYKFWEEKQLFHARVNPAKKPFTIVIPPPNVTGILHMGHALNNTIQDILIRYHRMKGREALWVPGTDHAGIATQNVVEKAIAKEGIRRQDLGREKFIERVWQWKEQYGSTIIHQLKKLGSSCDWQRTRFTMDDEYSRAVKEVFVSLWGRKPAGLIYQDNKVINWCPRCQTALSDEEAPHQELQGNLYYLRYPLKINPDEYVIVATTRPETMLGDTAVAVNPKDKRYKHLIGKTVILPLVDREIKIISDSMVDMDFATGAVKVTPAHDPNDYVLGKKHNLEFINILYPDGRLNENTLGYKGMDRFKAREAVLGDLKEKGLLEKVEPHQLSAGHCYRCHTLIEPYMSRQWFVRMKPLAKPAIEAVKKGKIKFHPRRWTKVYLNWMENIQDWCISRQVWWGHRIPLWYCCDCNNLALASVDNPKQCPACKSSNIKQDEDVLDTWFSSWLWPFAIFGWPFKDQGTRQQKELDYFYPTSVLVTAPEIIFFWVARMIMAGMEFMKDIPFSDVYIHGTVRDIEGKKMSKSLGNIIDPLEIINEYGADALRFSLISITSQGQDVFLSKERFEQGRNFANKIWNASRFILMNLDPVQAKDSPSDLYKRQGLGTVNRWILSRFYSVLLEVNKNLDAYKFNEAANALYAFFWHEFCDWYLEIIKPDIKNLFNQKVMRLVLNDFLCALHPFMPFITEEIWQKLNPPGLAQGEPASIMSGHWPEIQKKAVDINLEKEVQCIFGVINVIRNLRNEIELKPEQKAEVSIYPHSKAGFKIIEEQTVLIQNLSRLNRLNLLKDNLRPEAVKSAVAEGVDVYLHFSGLIDVRKEKEKLEARINEIKINIAGKQGRVKNRDFLKKAPPDVVQKEKDSIEALGDSLKRMEKMYYELG
ncbi:MAG: valine--tRNA ligase [Candidatus Omnitrophota bacterium]